MTWVPRRVAEAVISVGVLGLAVGYLARTADAGEATAVAGRVIADPAGPAAALVAYGLAFWLRSWAWCRVQPALPPGQAWAALHVGLLGNHLLPLRLGEALRPLSAARRGGVGLAEAGAATLTLRGIDLLVVLALAGAAAPAVLLGATGAAALAATGVLLLALVTAGVVWSGRHPGRVRRPDRAVVLAALLAWTLEAGVVLAVASAAGVPLTPLEAVGVTAATIAAQAVALTPGGFGTYEAAGAAALVAVGTRPGTAFAVALTTHAVKTAYAIGTGALALVAPGPSLVGRFRLPRARPPRPAARPRRADAAVVVVLPVHDEAGSIADVLARTPPTCGDHEVRVLVVDDGSTDGSGALAAAAGATVVTHPVNLGLGAALRRGLAEAGRWEPAAVVYLDSDGEYRPEQIATVAAPVLAGAADYVVGSRFTGRIERMIPRRRLGNRVLTRWLRFVARTAITDGQSGFRAFSAAAAAGAEIVHDYNYAQVLTLDLLGKGYAYAEVPITYSWRESGTSFVTLWRYLRRVLPAVHAELNATPPAAGGAVPVPAAALIDAP